MITTTLAEYGASLSPDGTICKGDRETSVRIVRKGKRLRFEGTNGHLLGSGPITPDTIRWFVKSFWFWECS